MRRLNLLACLPLLAILGACNTDPHARAVRYVENGNKFFEREKFKEASIMYRRAIASNADPLYGEAYYRLGLTSTKLGDLGGAYRAYLRAVELQPDNADALVKIGDIEIVAASQGGNAASKYLDEAEARAQKLLKMKDGAYDGHRLLGQIALLRKSPEAVSHFEQALKLKSDQPALGLAYFSALVENGRWEQGEKVALELIEKDKTYPQIYDLLYLQYIQRRELDKAEALMRRKVENNPGKAEFVLQLAAYYAAAQRRDMLDQTMARLNDEKLYTNGHQAAGDFYFLRMREFDKAQQQYEAGLKASPEDKALYQKRLVELFAATNRAAEANKILAEVMKDNPNDEEGIAMRAALRLSSGNRDEINLAVNDLQGLVSKAPTNHLLHFNLARALLAKGELEPARSQLEEAVKLRSDFVAARELLGRLYLARNEAAKALKEAETAIKLDGNNLSAHLTRSSALLILQQKDKAREELAAITRAFPQNADARYQMGLLAWQEKDYAKAAEVFGGLRKTNPSDLRGLVGVVETLAGQGNVTAAIKEMETALAAAPDRRELQVAMGNLYVRGQRYDDAIRQYADVVAKNPKDGEVLFKLAETYRRKGDLNQAIETFRKSSQADPNNANPLLQLGLLMDGTGRRDQSRPIYEQILRIQPENPVALNNLAFIKAEEGSDLDTALSMAQRAFQTAPGSPDIADTLGYVYVRKNLNQEAVRTLSALVQKHPENPIYRYHHGMALIQKGDRPAAKRELEAALNSGPSKDEAAKIQELLRTL